MAVFGRRAEPAGERLRLSEEDAPAERKRAPGLQTSRHAGSRILALCLRFLTIAGVDESPPENAVGVFGQLLRIPPSHAIERLDDRGAVPNPRQGCGRLLQSLPVSARHI